MELEDVVRVPPDRFGVPLKEVALEVLKRKYESILSPELGYAILVIDVEVDPVGKIIPGDGATYHRAAFTLLTYVPKPQEVVEGKTVEIADFGAFVRVGPADALLHLSQILDEYLTVDVKQGVIRAGSSGRTLTVGSKLRARITAVSMGRGAAVGKIALTCRQPFLGVLEWIQEALKKPEKPLKAEAVRREAQSRSS